MPLQARAASTREAIIEAAAQLLSVGGLAAFNTNAAAERAGVSIGSLYQYFPNKDALMVALIHRQQRRQLATLRAALDEARDEPLPGAVRRLVRAAMAHHNDDALLASAVDHEEARLPVAEILDGYLSEAREVIEALIAAHEGHIGAIAVDRAVRSLPALVRSVVDAWANLNPPQLNTAEDEAVRAVLGYLQAGGIDPVSSTHPA